MVPTKLRLQAAILRLLVSISGLLDRYLSFPRPQRVSFKRRIPATVGSTPGSIDLVFYTPKSYKSSSSQPDNFRGYPVVVNFHGGGFCVGNATDDERWASAVVEQGNPSKDAVLVSVDYRLAPEYPFPVGIEDCVSAVLYVWKHAAELRIDPMRTAFSGFSAGGNFTYAVAIRLHEELEKLKASAAAAVPVGRLTALVSFYPSVDMTHTRAERDASNPNLIRVVPDKVFRFFDVSYLAPKPDMRNPLFSPAVAADEVLLAALPQNMVMITCGGDQLLAEDEAFRKRLQQLGRRVDGYVVEGVGHGWDKMPTFRKGNKSRDEAYEFAVRSLQEFWGMKTA